MSEIAKIGVRGIFHAENDEMLSENISRLQKADADLVLIDPERKGKILKSASFSKCRNSSAVFEGWEVFGQPRRTMVRGKTVFENGIITAELGSGKILRKNSVVSGGKHVEIRT